MSILSTALVATSLIGASCTGTMQPGECPIQNPNCSAAVCTAGEQSCIKDQEQLKSFLNKYGVSVNALNQCGVQLPGCDNGVTGNPGGGIQPDGSDKPGNTPEDQPDSNIPGNNKPDGNPGGGGTEDTIPDSQKSYADQVVSLVNRERAKNNLSPLKNNSAIASAALVRSKEIVSSFSHTRPNGSNFSTVLKENGISYRGSGENIAWGQKTPEAVVSAWMNSPGHRANILNEKFTDIGVGYYVQNGAAYWTQLFTY